jgi:hypothetical protein
MHGGDEGAKVGDESISFQRGYTPFTMQCDLLINNLFCWLTLARTYQYDRPLLTDGASSREGVQIALNDLL